MQITCQPVTSICCVGVYNHGDLFSEGILSRVTDFGSGNPFTRTRGLHSGGLRSGGLYHLVVYLIGLLHLQMHLLAQGVYTLWIYSLGVYSLGALSSDLEVHLLRLGTSILDVYGLRFYSVGLCFMSYDFPFGNVCNRSGGPHSEGLHFGSLANEVIISRTTIFGSGEALSYP